MNDSKLVIRFKNHFKNLNFYSIPVSILFIVRKRLNFIFNFILILLILMYSLI